MEFSAISIERENPCLGSLRKAIMPSRDFEMGLLWVDIQWLLQDALKEFQELLARNCLRRMPLIKSVPTEGLLATFVYKV